MASSRYINFPFVTDARDLMSRAFDYLKTKVPGWQPAEGNLDVWLIEAWADQAADIATLTTEVPKTVFRYLGANLFRIPPIDATAATVNTTWFLSDALGHTIPAGTQVGIRDSTGALIPFAVLVDVIVPGGANQTAAGAVTLVAITPGAAASALGAPGGTVELIDSLAWVNLITQIAATSGGVDAETDDDYLTRLAAELTTIAPTPILPNDFAVLARNVAGVQRAVALDGYNPLNATYGNERMVTVAAVDAAGTPVATPVRTAIEDYLNAMREVSFVVHTMDANVQQIDITAQVSVLPGYNAADVVTRVHDAIVAYLDPATWGLAVTDDPNDPVSWNNSVIIRYLEVASLIDRQTGVDAVLFLTIGAHGGVQQPGDYFLSGVVPLPDTQNAYVVVTSL